MANPKLKLIHCTEPAVSKMKLLVLPLNSQVYIVREPLVSYHQWHHSIDHRGENNHAFLVGKIISAAAATTVAVAAAAAS